MRGALRKDREALRILTILQLISARITIGYSVLGRMNGKKPDAFGSGFDHQASDLSTRSDRDQIDKPRNDMPPVCSYPRAISTIRRTLASAWCPPGRKAEADVSSRRFKQRVYCFATGR